MCRPKPQQRSRTNPAYSAKAGAALRDQESLILQMPDDQDSFEGENSDERVDVVIGEPGWALTRLVAALQADAADAPGPR
jgi:hypothetical protein